jgi:hypothetical protein
MGEDAVPRSIGPGGPASPDSQARLTLARPARQASARASLSFLASGHGQLARELGPSYHKGWRFLGGVGSAIRGCGFGRRRCGALGRSIGSTRRSGTLTAPFRSDAEPSASRSDRSVEPVRTGLSAAHDCDDTPRESADLPLGRLIGCTHIMSNASASLFAQAATERHTRAQWGLADRTPCSLAEFPSPSSRARVGLERASCSLTTRLQRARPQRRAWCPPAMASRPR